MLFAFISFEHGWVQFLLLMTVVIRYVSGALMYISRRPPGTKNFYGQASL